MTNLIDIKCPINIYGDASRRSGRFTPDPDVVETINSYAHATIRDASIPISTANEVQSMQDVAVCKGCYIEMDQDFDLFLNGAVAALEFRRQDNATDNETEKVRAFLQCNLSSIGIGNPSSTVVLTGVLVIFGDPTA